MELKFKLDEKNNKRYLILKYAPGEWEKVEAKLKELGLTESKVNYLWKHSQAKETAYYRDANGHKVFDYVFADVPEAMYEDIANDNTIDPVFRENGVLNLSLFRVRPNVDDEVITELNYFPDATEGRLLRKAAAFAFERLLQPVEVLAKPEAKVESESEKKEVKEKKRS